MRKDTFLVSTFNEARHGSSTASFASPVLIYAAFTTVAAIMLNIAAARQVALVPGNPAYTVFYPSAESPGYWGVMSNWDGQWFRSIAENGYPSSLPLENAGLAKNQWAFWPLYPMAVRGVMRISGMGFGPSAWVVSVAAGSAAAVMLYRWVLPRMGRFGAGALLACVMAYVSAPILQVGYPESLTMLFIVWALKSLSERRYGVVALVAIGLALTRPVVLPVAAVVAIHGLARYRGTRRGADDFSRRDGLKVVGLIAWSCLLLGLWPLLADLITGERNVYLRTLQAWPANQKSDGVLGGWSTEVFALSPLGLLAIVVVLAMLYLAARPDAAVWGLELRTWAVMYPLYLLAATRPSPSILRYFLLAIAPLWPLPERLRVSLNPPSWTRWAFLGLLLVAGLVGQYYWVTGVFTVSVAPDMQPFP